MVSPTWVLIVLSTSLVALLNRMDGMLQHNSAHAIDWGAGAKPSYINEDAASNLEGLTISRQQVANAIGTFASIQSLLDAGGRGNLLLIANPTGG